MAGWKQKIFYIAPGWLKEFGVVYEAKRRNRFRRYGDYNSVREEYSFNRLSELDRVGIWDLQLAKINRLLQHARSHCRFYQERLPAAPIRTLDEFRNIPILYKDEAKVNLNDMISSAASKKDLYWDVSSGSTGTPFRYCVGREGIRARFAILDNFYGLYTSSYGGRRARISGVKVAPVDSKHPPFWIYNRVDNQLQFSAYHLSADTAPLYAQALLDFQPEYITGYAHAIFLLGSYFQKTKNLIPSVKAVFPDSENLLPEYRPVIEEGFNAPCIDNYGLGEVGTCAVQCSKGQYIELSLSHLLEVVDEKGEPVKPGEVGRVLVTDFTNYGCPFIRYDTGDLARAAEGCGCEWKHITHIAEIVGRIDDMIITPKGRWVGRLSHVTKPGVGIRESQIIQRRLDKIEIKIVPDKNFDPRCLDKISAAAKEYLGEEMKVEIIMVDEIPRSASSQKIKHVIREIDAGKPALTEGLSSFNE